MRCESSRFLILAVAIISLAACSQSDTDNDNGKQDQVAQDAANDAQQMAECELLMGWDPWEPYQYINAVGDVTGLDIEIARAVAYEAGCELEVKQDNWMNLLQDIREGEIDMVAGATHTPEREDSAWFTTPYRTESFLVYVRTGDLANCSEAGSLRALLENDQRIGTVADYYYGGVVTELQGDPDLSGQLQDSPVSELNYTYLLDQRIDGFIEDPFVATAIIRARGLHDEIAECPIVVHSGDVSFMLSRAGVDEETFQLFESALQELQAGGKLEEILNRYRSIDAETDGAVDGGSEED